MLNQKMKRVTSTFGQKCELATLALVLKPTYGRVWDSNMSKYAATVLQEAHSQGKLLFCNNTGTLGNKIREIRNLYREYRMAEDELRKQLKKDHPGEVLSGGAGATQDEVQRWEDKKERAMLHLQEESFGSYANYQAIEALLQDTNLAGPLTSEGNADRRGAKRKTKDITIEKETRKVKNSKLADTRLEFLTSMVSEIKQVKTCPWRGFEGGALDTQLVERARRLLGEETHEEFITDILNIDYGTPKHEALVDGLSKGFFDSIAVIATLRRDQIQSLFPNSPGLVNLVEGCTCSTRRLLSRQAHLEMKCFLKLCFQKIVFRV